MGERKVAFVMQGRLNSVRVPMKMLRAFAGTTLWHIALKKIEESGIPLEHVYIAARGELDKVAHNWASRTEWKNEDGWRISPRLLGRSEESANATNDPNKPDSLKLLYEWYEDLMRYGYTHVVLFNPCHPLVEPTTLRMFYDQYAGWDNEKVPNKGLFTVTRNANYFWDEDHNPITDWEGAQLMNTGKVKPVFEAAHVLYGSRLDDIEKECWMGQTSPPNPVLWIMNKYEAFDIDTLDDFEIGEVLYKHKRFKKTIEEGAKYYIEEGNKRNWE